ncbi:MAG: radical SAM protein, partial [Methanobacteriaceae archaeon]|nr:radical SAM protein [Methanobacteriaceae archaeon]
MVIKKTKSLCPECFKTLEAEVYEEHGKVMIKKECPEHGIFDNVYWSSVDSYNKAEECNYEGEGLDNPQTSNDKNCPMDCGVCPEHESHTILGLIDVTNRCNLKCPICFANAAVSKMLYEPSYEEIRKMLQNLRANQPVSTPAVQYAGGEPTVRKDIVDLIKL